jgi:hypothetical protein
MRTALLAACPQNEQSAALSEQRVPGVNRAWRLTNQVPEAAMKSSAGKRYAGIAVGIMLLASFEPALGQSAGPWQPSRGSQTVLADAADPPDSTTPSQPPLIRAPATQPPSAPGPGSTTPGVTAPRTSPKTAPAIPSAPPTAPPDINTLALADTTPPAEMADTGYSLASTPNMIGDTLGVGFRFQANHDFTEQTTYSSLNLAGGDRQSKIAGDTSPIPTDRVFLDFNHFNNAVTTATGQIIGLNCYSLGFEKTFHDGLWSIEVETPLAQGLNQNEDTSNTTGQNQETLLGDLSITAKCLLYRTETCAASIGLMVELPTAPRTTFTIPDEDLVAGEPFSFVGPLTMTIQNRSVHFEPFVGMVYAPNDRLFAIGFAQFDVDSNGNQVNIAFQPEESDPTLRDPTLLYLDASVGYWLYRDDDFGACMHRYVTGIAPVVELHYTTALQDFHNIDGFVVSPGERLDVLNLTGGLHFQLGPCSALTVGAVVPLRTNTTDKEFDSEIVAQFDRRF